MQKQSLNSQWRFYHGDIGRWWRAPIDESAWRLVDLPHDWSVEYDRGPDKTSNMSNGWFEMGQGHYRKWIDAPEEWRGKKVFIEFEGVYMNAEVHLNEHLVGRHPYGYTTFLLDLTPYLNYGEKNLLRVSVNNSGQLNSRWYSGSGIYRPVWLYVAEPVHIAHWGVYVTTPQVTESEASVRVQTKVWNGAEQGQEVTLRSRIIGPNGVEAAVGETSGQIEAGGSIEFTQDLTVSNPALWSIDQPNLYQLASEVLVDGRVTDTTTTTFGIRTIEFSAEKGFLLNGQPVLMKGGCVHHDNGILGSASYNRSEERKVEVHKASGYNAIRTAHNPPSPSFLEACDRLGMLVMDEAFDCWRMGKNPFDYHLSFEDWWQRDIHSMVLRDRNHPSVVVWSIGNEVGERDGRSNGGEIARMLADEVRRLDPTRPVTSAINGVHHEKRTWENTDEVFQHLDVGGYNYQWRQYRADHERHPQRIMAGTESFPLEALENWQEVEQLPYVYGDFVWTSLDYLGESGIGRVYYEEGDAFLGEYPWHQANCGDLDLCGFKRPQSYYRDIVWGVNDPLYIAVHHPVPEGKTPFISRWGWPEVSPNWTWPGHEGATFKVDVYSACEKVELFLNGHSLGVKPSTRAEKITASFEVPYEPGELKAVGYNGDERIAELALNTTGDPAQVRMTADQPELQAGEPDLCYVTVEVTDAQGDRHPSAENNVFFTIKGPGKILAVGSSNPTTTENYTGNQRRAFQGRCLVVVKSSGEAGDIRLQAHADGLDGAETVIKVA